MARIVIIGGGPAGYESALVAAQYGAQVTLIETDDIGGNCVLYDISPADEKALDAWEAADLGVYYKIRLRVQTLDGDVLAWLYVLQAYEGGLPSAHYIGVIADAAEAAGAPADYVADLRSRPCRSIS